MFKHKETITNVRGGRMERRERAARRIEATWHEYEKKPRMLRVIQAAELMWIPMKEKEATRSNSTETMGHGGRDRRMRNA